MKQVGKAALQHVGDEDEEYWDEEEWRPDPQLLAQLLDEGVQLIESGSSQAKWDAVCDLIDRFEGDKVVLFAQPVETVSVVAAVWRSVTASSQQLSLATSPTMSGLHKCPDFNQTKGPVFLFLQKLVAKGLICSAPGI